MPLLNASNRNVQGESEMTAMIYQEYGSELNAVSHAFRIARENGMPGYAIECKYGWIAQALKPSLRFGRVWECRDDGKKYPA
jgi:hypothetical protein